MLPEYRIVTCLREKHELGKLPGDDESRSERGNDRHIAPAGGSTT
jgi:hypothetical protein